MIVCVPLADEGSNISLELHMFHEHSFLNMHTLI